MIVMVAIRQRPASSERSSRSTRRAELVVNRSISAPPAPRVLLSCTPLIDSPSSMVTLRSASSRWRWAVISRRIAATRRVSQMAGGSTTNETRVSRQDSATMATRVATTVVRLDAIEVAVEVTTACMPPMSLVIRDCTSPVRVRVKNAIDCRCRWAKTSVRSRCITSCPTRVEIQVCATPSTAVTAATAIMPTTSQTSRVRSRSGNARSITARSRKGEAIATIDDTTMIAVTTANCPRYAVNSRPIRRSETARAWDFSAALTVRGAPPRPSRWVWVVSKGSFFRPGVRASCCHRGWCSRSGVSRVRVMLRLPHHEVATATPATVFR